jgi:hypothetical protein
MPDKYKKDFPKVNEELSLLKGELTDIQAKVALGKFLRANLGLGLEILTKRKLKLAYYQEILMKAIFNRNFSLIVASRGGSKSFLAAIIAFLIPIFNKGTNVLIAGPTFRTARHIFTNLERIIDSEDGKLLKACFGTKTKRNDAFEYEINGGVIRAVPMNSDKIRGFRANVLILDEFLLLSEDVVRKVLIPFLIVPTDITKKMIKSEEEDILIESGKMKEEERATFPSSARMICLTSASYTFEYAAQIYREWITNIMDDTKVEDATYFVAQIGWEAVPKYLVEKSVIEEASSMGKEDAIFQREFGAQFTDGSSSYFSYKKMHVDLTVKDGEKPSALIKGNPNDLFVLSIDPNFSQSPSADFFAMSVLKLDIENERATLVHNYGKAGVDLGEHIKYFYYLLNAFNPVLICSDNADGNFIQSANESSLFENNKIKLDFVEYDGELKDQDYIDMIRKVRNQYNYGNKKICFKHIFNQQSIRRINEQLQTWINTNRIWFGSKLTQLSGDYDIAIKGTIPYPFEENQTTSEFIYELISDQDDWMGKVKKQCSLIEITVSPVGGQVFNLPQNLLRQSGLNRPRRDNYTSLLLGVEAAQTYFNLMKQPPKEAVKAFIPFMAGQSTM